MKSAKIENNIVVNVAVGMAYGYIECPDNTMKGDKYEDGVFTPSKNESSKDEQIEVLKSKLSDTDYIERRWEEETKLNIPHHQSNEDYMKCLQERQSWREQIRLLEGANE